MDLALLALLIFVNGIFAMSEIAVISSRDARLRKLANDGGRGARTALTLKNNPTSFLSTIQVGITMVGILSGAIGENALVEPLNNWLGTIPLLQSYSKALALGAVVVVLTYFSVVVGELVPKHLGLLAPERVASLVARPMRMLARVAKPLVWFFSVSSGLLLKMLKAGTRQESAVTDEEIRILMEQGSEAGVFHESEQILVSNVLRLDEQPVVAIMTPRQDLYLLDLNKPDDIHEQLANSPFTRIIVCRGGLNNVVGLLRTADLLKAALTRQPLEIEKYLRKPLYVPEFVTTTQLLENFRKVQLQCALIVDEYGHIQGFVTLTDVLTAIIGEVPSDNPNEDQDFVRRDDGSWLIGGGVSIERVKLTIDLTKDLPGEKNNIFHTLGGFVIHSLGRIPKEADNFTVHGYRFEVIDMDRHRVDKVLVAPIDTE